MLKLQNSIMEKFIYSYLSQSDVMEYLVFVDYLSDAERKRIDYAIEKWRDRAEVSKQKGMAIRFKDGDIDDFLDHLCSRLGLGRDQITVFDSKLVEPEVKAQQETLKYRSTDRKDVIEKFLSYVLSKINAQYEFFQNGVARYNVSTKKGQARIDVRVTENPGGCETVIQISGYGNVTKFIRDRLDEELQMFLGGK